MSDFHINIVQLFYFSSFHRLPTKTCTEIFPSSKKLFLLSILFFLCRGKGFHFLYTAHRNKELFRWICSMMKNISCLTSMHGLLFLLHFVSNFISFRIVTRLCVWAVFNKIFPFSFSSLRTQRAFSCMLKKTCCCMLSVEHVDNLERSDNMRDFLNWKFLKIIFMLHYYGAL